MERVLRYILVLLSLLFLVNSCIVNDIPYPYTPGVIEAFEVGDQKSDALIDVERGMVSIELSEAAELDRLKLVRFEVNSEATISPEITEYISLVDPLEYTLTTYPGQEYKWTIIGNQNIERFLIAENQVGKTEIDNSAKAVAFYISSDLTNVNILDIKLGPQGSTIFPNPLEIKDYTHPVKVSVTYKEKSDTWTIYAFHKEPEVVTESVDPWATHAYLYGTFAAGMSSPTFKYQKEGDSDWKTFPIEDIKIVGSEFSGVVTGLLPSTKYRFKSVSGDSEGEELPFTTEDAPQLPNMGFDDWYQSGSGWFPSLDATSLFWDSANGGTASFGYVPTLPEDVIVKKGKAAKLSTLEAKVMVIVKLAAGNLFTGKFGKVVVSGGGGATLDFGRPFTSRPSAMRGWIDYRPAIVDKYCDVKYEEMRGKSDHGQVYVLLTDWETPKNVNTTTGNFIDPINDPSVIGYGEITYTQNTNGYVEFNIPIEYRNRKTPTHIVVVCSASKYGDYFTGGVGSVMYADEFEFEYGVASFKK